MKNFLKFGAPILTVLAIIVIGFLMLNSSSMNTTTSNSTGSSQSCDIKFQPDVKKYSSYPAMCIDQNKSYTATINTNTGKIVVNLFPKTAPKTVNSFVFLSKSGFFNNLLFHRVIPGFVIQAGDPNGDGTGGPGYSFNDEINSSSPKILAGTLAMANSGPNTNGSQFFIALTDQPSLDGGYTPFGQVKSGMDIANKIAAVSRDSNDKPLSNVVISSIDISEN